MHLFTYSYNILMSQDLSHTLMFSTDLYHFPRITWLVENEKMSELRKNGQGSRTSKKLWEWQKAEAIALQNSILKQKQSHLGSKTRTEHELSAVRVCSGSDAVFFRIKQWNLRKYESQLHHIHQIHLAAARSSFLYRKHNGWCGRCFLHTEAPMGLAGLVWRDSLRRFVRIWT